jgi:hypothetical protein
MCYRNTRAIPGKASFFGGGTTARSFFVAASLEGCQLMVRQSTRYHLVQGYKYIVFGIGNEWEYDSSLKRFVWDSFDSTREEVLQ